MHPQFLERLCCPETGEPLHLRATETLSNGMAVTGCLTAASGREYPIVRGIPRFVGAEHYAGSFGFEWNRWPRVQFEAENKGGPMEGWTRRMWERITEAGEGDVAGKTIVEFGCGPGRFLDVVRSKEGKAVGIDLSGAVEAARKNFSEDPDVLIVQGDLLNPPFPKGSFDGGYSIGVLHHTPDPAKGLIALTGAVRPGGWVACCVYPKGELYDFPSTARFRRLHARLKGRFGYGPALAYAHFSARVLAPLYRAGQKLPGVRGLMNWVARQWLVIVWLPDVRWRVLDTFDAITPSLATTHTEAEVRGWFREAGCVEVRRTDWCSTSFRGVRPALERVEEAAAFSART